MTIEILSRSASTENRQAARQWVDAFNARDDEGEADARTADYIGHAPDSMRLPALDSNAWVAFLGTGPAAMEAYCRFEHVCGAPDAVALMARQGLPRPESSQQRAARMSTRRHIALFTTSGRQRGEGR